MIHVRTPATTANMGPGFDTIGMSFSLYNHIWVEEWTGGGKGEPCLIELKNDDGRIPKTSANLVYQAMSRFYYELDIRPLPPVRIVQEDHIPLTRGLGSSAACVVGGLAAANALAGRNLSRDDLAFLAAKIEGHPDNAAPAVYGGVVVGVLTKDRLSAIKIENDFIKSLKFAVMVPNFYLSTHKSRRWLPKNVPLADGIFNASRTALLVGALTTGDVEKLQVAMDDRFHQPYRSKIIPSMDAVFKQARSLGAKGVFLSGAGPAIVALASDDGFIGRMKPFLDSLPHQWDIDFIPPDFTGLQISDSGVITC